MPRARRPTEVPDEGLLCDVLWSDPEPNQKGWGENDRGVSFTFGTDVVTKFLNRHDLDLVCRAHQVVEDGYEFFADRQLVTVRLPLPSLLPPAACPGRGADGRGCRRRCSLRLTTAASLTMRAR